MLSPRDLPQPPIQQLLVLVAALVTMDERAKAARELAAALGCGNLLIFIVDADLGVLLPAPGFPQTLPDARRWTRFLRECVPGSICRSNQTFPGSTGAEQVVAAAAQDGTVLVLAGGDPDVASLDLVVSLLPLVSSAFSGQQAARSAQAQAVMAEQTARNAEGLTQTLDETRRRLQRALGEAEQALRIREEFLTVASHELKTPLTALKLQVQLLERAARRLSDSTPFTRKIEDMVARMDRSVQRLSTLTSDLLDVSRMAAGRLAIRREPVDLSDLAREVMDRFVDEAGSRGCRLELWAVEAVEGHWDHSRLDQVITNLLGNALAYAQGTPIDVHVVNGHQSARIEVRDQGPGIALPDQERVFHRFERARPTEDGTGLGLGLHIAREIVHAHDGRIFVDSRPGAGATFVVELPYGR